jgi:RimJ/RimL family protein N-acetyltransferase
LGKRNDMVELETDRLRFRLARESDVESVYEFHADPLTVEIYKTSFTRAEIWRRIALGLGHWQIRGFGGWTLESKVDGTYVGQCGFWFPEGWADIEIGYGIHPKFRGLGLAVEAAKCVREFGYDHHKFKRLVSYIQPSNLQSIRVAEKLGAKPNGEFMMGDIPHTIYLHQQIE